MSSSPDKIMPFSYGHNLLRPKVLYVSDMDGTLLDTHSRITTRTANMLNEAIAAGALFTVATARTPATVTELMSGIDMRLPGIVMTGAALFDFASHTFSRVCCFPSQTVERMIKLYRIHEVSTFIYTINGNTLDVFHIGELNQYERDFIAERSHSPVKNFHVPPDGESVLPDRLDNTVLLFSVQPWEKAHSLYTAIKEAEIPCTPLCYHDAFGDDWGELEMFGPHTSKAAAVEALASDIGASRIVAFGDNVNDIPLFDLADRGIAVANAIPQLRDKASEIIGGNDEDAVAKYILSHSKAP